MTGKAFGFATSGYPAASSAAGRPRRTRRARRWRLISCTCFSRRAIPKRRKPRRCGGLSRRWIEAAFLVPGVEIAANRSFHCLRMRVMLRPQEMNVVVVFVVGHCWYHHANEILDHRD